jgi:hypothetical protein
MGGTGCAVELERRPQFGRVPSGGYIGKSPEPQIVLKTDQRTILLELGLGGKSEANQAAGMRTEFFLEGDKLEVSVKNSRCVPTHLPAGPRSKAPPVQHYFPTNE